MGRRNNFASGNPEDCGAQATTARNRARRPYLSLTKGGLSLTVRPRAAPQFSDFMAAFDFHIRAGRAAMIAGALFAALAATSVRAGEAQAPGGKAARRAHAVAGLVVVQAIIGITTLLLVVPIPVALLHQAFAMMVLAMAVVHRRRLADA